MIYGPFSLEGATSAEFSFNYWLNSESGYDFFKVLASINGSYFYGYEISGERAAWYGDVFDLTDVYMIGDLTGQPQVWIAFLFTSDDSINCEAGVYVDDVVIRASVSQSFTITASAGVNGGISPSGNVTVIKGQDQTFNITPDPGYQVAFVDVDGFTVGALTQYTFTNVQSNHTIYAMFDPIPPVTYTITASAGANGGISPSGDVTVIEGQDQTFDITPDPGYQVADVNVDGSSDPPSDWLTPPAPIDWVANVDVDGSSVGTVTQYTFTNVQSNHTIHATFEPIPPVTLEVFLPLILNQIILLPPDIPVLNKINNPAGGNDYTVSWQTAANATNYILQEADDNNFTGASTVYDGPNTSVNITGKDVGTYFYRVKSKNAAHESAWSNTESVEVTVEMPDTPVPGNWSGTSNQGDTISYTVSDDGTEIIKLDLFINFGGKCGLKGMWKYFYKITISDNKFIDFRESWDSYEEVEGTFTSTTDAEGTFTYRDEIDMGYYKCKVDIKGEWTASASE